MLAVVVVVVVVNVFVLVVLILVLVLVIFVVVFIVLFVIVVVLFVVVMVLVGFVAFLWLFYCQLFFVLFCFSVGSFDVCGICVGYGFGVVLVISLMVFCDIFVVFVVFD